MNKLKTDFEGVVVDMHDVPGTITLLGDLADDKTKGGMVVKAVNDVFRKGHAEPVQGLKLIPFYHIRKNTLELRFRRPQDLRVSEPMAIITVRDKKTLSPDTITKIMGVLSDPDIGKCKIKRGRQPRQKA